MDLSNLTWLTPKQAAEYLQLKEQTLRKRRSRGDPPEFKRIDGRIVRYKRADLDAWLESGAA